MTGATQTGYAMFCAAVEITTANNVLKFMEGAGTLTATLPAGTYFLRGNGDADDLARIVYDALAAAPGAVNTYDVAVDASVDLSQRPAKVTVSKTGGAATFKVLWNDAATTFESESFLGFTTEKAGADNADEVSTVCPENVWTSNDAYREHRRAREWLAGEVETADGNTDVVRRSEKRRDNVIELRFIADARCFEEAATTGQESDTLEHFIDVNGDGRLIEVHEAILAAGATSFTPPIADLGILAGVFVLGQDAQRFAPRRVEPGLALFDVDLRLLGASA